jgi:hypothetical protein
LTSQPNGNINLMLIALAVLVVIAFLYSGVAFR